MLCAPPPLCNVVSLSRVFAGSVDKRPAYKMPGKVLAFEPLYPTAIFP